MLNIAKVIVYVIYNCNSFKETFNSLDPNLENPLVLSEFLQFVQLNSRNIL